MKVSYFPGSFVSMVKCLLLLCASLPRIMCVTGLTPEQKQLILNTHNDIRANVLPVATNMKRMNWDVDLAELAQAHANNCSRVMSALNVNISVIGLDSVGINILLAINGDDPDYSGLLDIWHKEEEYYDYHTNTCNDSFCDNYKQMVWAASSKLGCGSSLCSQIEGWPLSDSLLFVCYYSPSAYSGQPYDANGESCSKCIELDGSHCDLSSLCVTGLSDSEKKEFLNSHNSFRSNVEPKSDNMRRMVWSDELAVLAQSHADKCVFDSNYQRHQQSSSFDDVGESMFITDSVDMLISSAVQHWNDEQYWYDFGTGKCHALCVCVHYLQVVAAESRDVGCGISRCPLAVGYRKPDAVLLVCNYGPGFNPGQPPYQTGDAPCIGCPKEYSVCKNRLCSMDETMMMGSDPHFSVLLPSGNMLCYTVQGEQNMVFNLISNEHLEMNALFVPDKHTNNTWLGSIGITVLSNESKLTQLKFDAVKQTVTVGMMIKIDARSIKKLSFRDGKLNILESQRNELSKHPRTLIHLEDSEIQFSINFVKQCHLDLVWHSVGQSTENTHGLIGQFLRKGVRIDEETEALLVPGREAVPVRQRHAWNFVQKEFSDEQICWTPVHSSNQGKHVIEGSYKDYKVANVLSTEFRSKRIASEGSP